MPARMWINSGTMITMALAACGGGGSNSTPPPPPVITMSLSSTIIPLGKSATLTWSAQNAKACTASLTTYAEDPTAASNWSGIQPPKGSVNLTPSTPNYDTYALNCTGNGVSAASEVVLTVSGPTPSEFRTEGTQNDQFIGFAFELPAPNAILDLRTTLIVPPLPPVPTSRTLLGIWPGLDPLTSSTNFNPVNGGLLQPVLGWGLGCGQADEPTAFSSWWIQPYYVNGFTASPVYGCSFGGALLVNPGDQLSEEIQFVQGSDAWVQSMTDLSTSQTVTWPMNLQQQSQNRALFYIEAYTGTTVTAPVTFANTTMTLQAADSTGMCSAATGAAVNFVMTPPTPSANGTQCTVAFIVLDQSTVTPTLAGSIAEFKIHLPNNQ